MTENIKTNGNSDELITKLKERFGEQIELFILPPTFVNDRCGVDVHTKNGTITVVWKIDYGRAEDSIFSMCVVDGSPQAFKNKYKSAFSKRYTELDGVNEVYNAIARAFDLGS